jgi:RNA polymerase sigma factor (sigma-70 family)
MRSIADSAAAPTATDATQVAPLAARRVREAKAVLLDLEQREGQALFGFAVRLGLTSTEAQDAVQETLLRLWSAMSSGSIERPRAWAYRTIYRVAMDEHRLRRRSRAILDRIGRFAGRPALPPAELVDIWASVDRLSNRQRQVIYLRYQADLAFEEIGATLGISAGAARSHASTALHALRTALAKEEGWS